MILWVGQSVSPQVLLDLFGVDDINSLDRRMVSLSLLHVEKTADHYNRLIYRNCSHDYRRKYRTS